MLTTILFDLDGTLLQLDEEKFSKIYFQDLSSLIGKYGVSQTTAIKSVTSCINKMIKNDGQSTNEFVFWQEFQSQTGLQKETVIQELDEFYLTTFQNAKSASKPVVGAKELIKNLKDKGYKLVLATNPLFPRQATLSRIAWAGLEASDFDLITTYENSSYCKPNPQYYQEIITSLDVDAEACLMIGNNAIEDLAAEKIGIKAYLITDHLKNKEVKIFSGTKYTFEELIKELERLPRR